ncbi:ethylene-responsive transcription factor-like protein At4g13040 [Cucurbita maxima]|uniref:Ethylene-responsive transcription factor-like protein At4g13040 n=1 Tax=Cucurbita maxima TaxID=3661 RepID=A0A6J1K7F1_CUCMA|nr:ethylene-responsive transcription factor-like protein At4g13040 [Cucurbita maxima]XP_022995969.1 ethylene-responsive transcription factor-like protein At4g13040 [Cucurbita maxima]XP_022995970.1 ethylene-responsive transcription factor-like protein At4g13040 [Cucurbita maxima]
MVSLRRRKLLGLCTGKGSFDAPVSKFSENSDLEHCSNFISVHPIFSNEFNEIEKIPAANLETEPLRVSVFDTSKEKSDEPFEEPPVKHRKQHRRKHFPEECFLMRGVYFKNMKWQAAIKVDKKQIHLGTVGSQEEAAHLYDRAAFMCGREPNFELPEAEKKELRKFNWDEFLAMTRLAIANKKQKRVSPESKNSKLPILGSDDLNKRQDEFSDLSAPEDIEPLALKF